MKYFLLVSTLLITLLANAQTLTGGVEFDWVNLSQSKRSELIQEYKNATMVPLDLTFEGANKKDKDFLLTQKLIKEGVEETQDKVIAGFFKYGVLVAYGVIEKSQPKKTLYYNALGTLVYVDISSEDYDTFPSVTCQYDAKGRLVGRIYSKSKYDQFMYDKNGKFLGRWYENKMYNAKGKETATRTWW